MPKEDPRNEFLSILLSPFYRPFRDFSHNCRWRRKSLVGENKAKIPMPTAQHLRAQIEANLADRIPSALTPLARIPSPVAPTGICEIDALLHGGFPIGAISEIVGPECSGRTSLALAFLAGMTQEGKVCAWVDVSDTLHPESAAALGVDLSLLLWIRCGVLPGTVTLTQSPPRGLHTTEKTPKVKPGLPPGGGGHPRMESKGLSIAVSDLLGPSAMAPRCAEALRKPRPEPRPAGPQLTPFPASRTNTGPKRKLWSRLEQGLRVSDLLLQAGGFSCIVLDMGSLPAEYALRVPLATWFRFRGAAERLQANVLLLTQHACSRNSAGVVLRLNPGNVFNDHSTTFTGLEHTAELARQRFPQDNVLPLRSTASRDRSTAGRDRKPPQSVQTAAWQTRTVWAGPR
jgi:recombination protein RecA